MWGGAQKEEREEGKEGQEGGELEEHQSLSRQVDSSPQNGPKPKKNGSSGDRSVLNLGQ